jgi:putative transposase
LHLSERHVRRILAAFVADGFAGLEDQRTRPAEHPANQLTLPFLKDVLTLQREYPRAGKFRVQGLLQQQHPDQPPPSVATVGRAMARNRQFHQAPGPWLSAHDPAAGDATPKLMRYKPLAPHHYWFIDIRYLVQLAGHWVYSICILDGYSRQILAGMAVPQQDTIAVLQLLYAALAAYGRPAGLVSDNGSVFTSQEYTAILRELGIWACYIDKGKPWQNLIEAQFKVQLRLADAKFEQAADLAAIEAAHAAFIETFNTTPHWAHRRRADGARTPAQVLEERQGRPVGVGMLEQIFKAAQWRRTVNRHGYVSIQRFYLYAERGLARQRVAIWIYEGTLRLEYEQTLLARYTAQYNRQSKQLQQVTQPQLYPTPYQSPQLELWELDEQQWQKVRHLPERGQRRRRLRPVEQLALPGVGIALWVSTLLLDEPWSLLLRALVRQG